MVTVCYSTPRFCGIIGFDRSCSITVENEEDNAELGVEGENKTPIRLGRLHLLSVPHEGRPIFPAKILKDTKLQRSNCMESTSAENQQ